MAKTENIHTGSTSTGPYSFTFPYIKEADVKVSKNDVVLELTTDYTQATTSITLDTAPLATDKIRIYRVTDDTGLPATFYPGSAIRSADLNDNFTQNLYSTQEVVSRYMDAGGGTFTGDVTLAEDVDIIFEGATDDAYETKLEVADPTADRVVTIPDFTGTLITTGDTGTVTSTMILDGGIASVDIANLAITTEKLNADAVNATKIADNAIDSEHYVDGSIDRVHLAADIVDGTKIADDSINSEHYVAGSIDNEHLADDAVNSDELAAGAVDLAHMSVNSVDSNQYVDGSIDAVHLASDSVTTAKITNLNVTTGKLAADAVTAAKIADDSINSEHYVDGSIDTAHIADSQVTTAKIADNAVTIAKVGCEQTTITDSDSHVPTSGAVIDYVVAQIAPLGGLEVITTEILFPNTQPSAGVVISISDAGGVVFNGSGSSTTGRTEGGSTVTINGAPSSLYSETLVAGVGLMVSSTGTGQVYNYHKILGKEDDIKQLSDDINDFNARYRVASSAPSSANDSGDLYFNTTTPALHVYTGSAWIPGVSTTPNDDTVTGAKIVDNAIDSEHYTDGSIDTVHIANDAVETAKIADLNVTTAKLAADVVTSAKLADNAVDSEHYVDGSIDLVHMSADSVDSDQYVDGSIDLVHMSADSVDSNQYVDGSIDLVHMSADSVDSNQYVDGSIDLVHMSADSVDSDQYVDGSIDLVHMSADSVDSDQYVDGSIDLVHMSADSVDSDQYVDGSIDTVHIADDAVDATKLANSINTEIAANTAKITNATHTGDVTGSGALTIAANSVDGSKLTDNIDIAGTLDVTSAATFDSTGTFAGDMLIGGTSAFANNAVTISSSGYILCNRSSGAGLLIQQDGDGTSGDNKISLGVDGAASFAGDLRVGSTSAFAGAPLEVEVTGSTAGAVGITLINAIDSDASATCVIRSYQENRAGGDIVFGRENASDWSASAASADGFISFNPTLNGVATEAMRIDSDGKVGINETNPTNLLHIAATGSAEGILIKSTGDTYNDLDFDSNRSTAESGLGIIRGYWNGTRVAQIALASGSDTTNKDDGIIQFSTSSANNITEVMRIDGSGNVGIGTTSPSTVMHLKDSTDTYLTLQAGSTDGNDAILFKNSAGTQKGAILFDTDDDYMIFSTDNTERMKITSDGATKMTTTDDYYSGANTTIHEMRVNNSNNWIGFFTNHTGSSPYGITIRYPNDSPNGTGSEAIHFEDSTTSRFTVRSNGGIANYSSNDTNLCDEREKKNIEPLDSTWDCLKNWELKKFHYNEADDTEDKKYGVIAQQVASHCPEVITDWIKQKAEDAVLDDDGNVVTPAREEVLRKGVKEQQMMWMAIKALQEAITKIETLETKVAALEAA
jgi:hypothetical protein